MKILGYKLVKDNKKKLFKTVLLSLFLLQFIGCEESSSPEEQIKFFHPDRLSQLSLDSVGRFWTNDTINRITDYVTFSFDMHPGHLSSISYSSVKGNALAVSVFETQEIAIDAMEERINETSAVIFSGDSHGDMVIERDRYFSADIQKRIKDKWWWSIFGAHRNIYINKWNTIIGVSNYNELPDSSRILVEYSAIEIANRVDALSE